MADLLLRDTDRDQLIADVAAAVVAELQPVLERTRDRGLLSREQIATFLGISEPSLDRMVREDRIPSIRLGSRRMFAPDAVLAKLGGEADGD